MIVNRCKELRGNRTQTMISSFLGITQQQYSNIEKAKEIIPTIEYPQWYFNDVSTHLYQKYGIKFKNHREDMVDRYLNKRY